MFNLQTWETLQVLDCGAEDVASHFTGDLELPQGLEEVIRNDWEENIKKTVAELLDERSYDKLILIQENGFTALYGVPEGRVEEQRIRTPGEQGILTYFSALDDGSRIDLSFARVFYPYTTAAELPEFQECYDRSDIQRPLGGLGVCFLALTSGDQIVTARRGATTFRHGLYGPGGNWNYGVEPKDLFQSQISSELDISPNLIDKLRFTGLIYDKTGGKRPELTGIAYINTKAQDIAPKTDMDTDVKAIVPLGKLSPETLLQLLKEKSAPPDLNQRGEWDGLLLNSYAATIAMAGYNLYGEEFARKFHEPPLPFSNP